MDPNAASPRRWKVLVRVALSSAALAWVVHVTPLHSMTAALASAAWLPLSGGLLLNFLARLAAAERNFVVSRGLGMWITRWQTIETLFISNFYALLSPGPMLSGVVTVYRYRGYGASVSGSVGALLASRALECMVFVAMGAACVLGDPHVPLARVRYPLGLAALMLAMVTIATLVWGMLHRRWRQNPRASPRFVSSPGSGVLAQLRAIQHELMRRGPSLALEAALPACAQVLLAGAAMALLARSVGIDLTMLTSIWLTAAVYAVVLLPISVAGVGVREMTLASSLGLLGIDTGLAVALSILLFLDPLINAVIGGALQLRSTLASAQRQA